MKPRIECSSKSKAAERGQQASGGYCGRFSSEGLRPCRRAGSGAQVVGSLSPELPQQRLAADRKALGQGLNSLSRQVLEKLRGRAGWPPEAEAGQEVYGANELYDRRSNRRRAQKKQGAGQTTQITEAAEHKRVIKMEEAILVSELAHQMGRSGCYRSEDDDGARHQGRQHKHATRLRVCKPDC